MKRCFYIFIFLIPQIVYGQNHMQFLGHAITGDIKTFVNRLKSEGFKPISKKYKFGGMKTKTLKGTFWKFPECHIVVRQPLQYEDVTSVYIHPLSNYVLLPDLVESLDAKYGKHEKYNLKVDVNAITLVWNIPKGQIHIFASTIYGQVFDILYSDYQEVKLLNNLRDKVDRDL